MIVSSIAPSRIRFATTAHSTRSARNLGKIRPTETALEGVAGATDPLQPAGDRLRRLDLDHQVDRAHVDAQLQRRGRDEARQLPRLQQLLDDRSLLVGERAMVGPGDLDRRLASCRVARPVAVRRRARSAGKLLLGFLVGELVQPLGEALAARRLLTKMIVEVCSCDQLQELGVDRRPDRAGVRRGVEVLRRAASPIAAVAAASDRGARIAHVLHRDVDLQVQLLAAAGVGDLALAPGPTRNCGDPLERTLRRRQPDPLRDRARRSRYQVREALEGQGQVSAALGLGDRVDLVDDHRLVAAQDLAEPARSSSGRATPGS